MTHRPSTHDGSMKGRESFLDTRGSLSATKLLARPSTGGLHFMNLTNRLFFMLGPKKLKPHIYLFLILFYFVISGRFHQFIGLEGGIQPHFQNQVIHSKKHVVLTLVPTMYVSIVFHQ